VRSALPENIGVLGLGQPQEEGAKQGAAPTDPFIAEWGACGCPLLCIPALNPCARPAGCRACMSMDGGGRALHCDPSLPLPILSHYDRS